MTKQTLGIFLRLMAEEFDKKMKVKGSHFVYQKYDKNVELLFTVGDTTESLFMEHYPENTIENRKEVEKAAKMLYGKMVKNIAK